MFLPTDDDWCPSYKILGDKRYQGSYVSVQFLWLGPSAPKGVDYRVYVSGMDDLAMEFDSSENNSMDTFLTLCTMGVVNKQDLLDQGFTYR